ncbi:MAG: FAD-dependent oxidoreductase [Microbacterium gubbeenense]|uniref:FAD-dependent oxidoreductase n=3 Tax=Microbacterium gubbeenense TaxID=159896 RepID=UPI003F99DE77
MNTQPWDVIIVGGGAAGLSAALMLGRSRRRTLVIDTGSPRNRFAAHMHGVLGNEGSSPADLIERGRTEAAGYGVEFLADAVERVDETGDGVRVTLRDGDPLDARALIVASGLVDDLPDVPGLAERWGKSVLHCPYCHGWEVRGQRLAILATSPLGLHHAQLVRQWTDDLTVFTADIGPMDDETIHRLRSRGIRLIASPVTEVLGDGDQVTGVRTADGHVTELDAIFTAATLRPRDEFLQHLDLKRTENPMGNFLATDEMGQTSSSRIWAVGNVTNAGANVPMSIGAGASAGAVVNMALVTEDFDRAVAEAESAPDMAPADYWEHRYAGPEHMWSGRVNKVVSDVASGLTPGRSLDLGCGEGGDAIWLAKNGWTAAGIDISASAIGRARTAAHAAGLTDDQISFAARDLSAFDEAGQYDLVTASFLHSPVELARGDILRAAADLVAPGGHLLITSHASSPPWAEHSEHHTPHFLSPEEEFAALDLSPDEWTALAVEVRPRETTDPHGNPATIDDSVILLRRER